MGLITPNIFFELNQNQPNPQLISRVQTLPVYNPYVSFLDDYRPSGLYMDKIEHPQHYVSYHSQSVIKDLRAGDSRVKEAAWLLITIWMLQHQSVGFQPVRQAPPPPHRQLFGGTLNTPRNNYFSKSSQPGASLQMERPSAMPHQDFIALTKEQRRNLPDPKDGFIDVEGHPKLTVRYVAYLKTVDTHADIIVTADFKASIHHLLASGLAAFSIICRASSSLPCLIFLQMEETHFESSLFSSIGLHCPSCWTESAACVTCESVKPSVGFGTGSLCANRSRIARPASFNMRPHLI